MSKRPTLTRAAVEYLGQWAKDADQFDDYRAFYERGYYEVCAARIVGAGAVESADCEATANILAVARALSHAAEWKQVDECLDGVSVFTCSNCNAVSFVDLDSIGMEQPEFAEAGCPCCDKKTLTFDRVWRTGKRRSRKG